MVLGMNAPVLHRWATQLVSSAGLPDIFASPGFGPSGVPLHRAAGNHRWVLGKAQTPALSFGLG